MGCPASKHEDAKPPASQSSSPAASASGGNNLEFLGKVELFKRLPAEEHKNLEKACSDVEFEPGATIITQGDMGNEFFIIKSGSCKVEVNGNMMATLKQGDYFGEMALLRDEPRTATITAQTKTNLMKITRDKFGELGLNEKVEFAKRGAVGGGASGDAEIKDPSPKTDAEVTLMTTALKNNANLNSMISLDGDKLSSMIKLMWKEEVAAQAKIITQGDLNADYFYIVQTGSFDVSKGAETQSADKHCAAASVLAQLGVGASFGELALLYFSPRAATITATVASTVWVLARQQFKRILQDASADHSAQYVKHLDKVKVLDSLKDAEKRQLASALTDFVFTKNECIFEQGEKGVLFYILVEGEVSVVKDGRETASLKATSEEAQFFGEQALLTAEPRGATIKVTSATATALAVDKTSFDMLLGPLDELQKRGKEGNAPVRKTAFVPLSEKTFGNIARKDLVALGLLGCGGFGAVEMVEHKPTANLYALKALSKGYVLKTGMQHSVMSEKDVQLMCNSTFVIQLYETYNGSQSLYLLLELALGGELYATYNKKSLWGNEKCAKFYVAGTVFAFDHLHSKKIIFRDLKPENLLLNNEGRLKLTDMGLAKFVVGKTYTTCGTPDYFAPELIQSKGHGEAVDWWTLGILNYELLGGHPPFESPAPMQIYQKVTKGINKVQFPKACKGTVESLIKGNCAANPAERLPMKKGGSNNIKKHPWFEGFDWEKMENLTLEPPYKPLIKNNKDASNFSARQEDMPPQVPYKDPKNGWDEKFATSK